MQVWLPLFPLQVVLLPEAELPLHIFEDRYKEMIAEVLRDKIEFGVVLANDKGIVNTGCTAVIERVLREYPDGRLDILTVGRRRFEIERINDERAFLRGEVEYFDDEDEPASEDEFRARAIAGYNELRALTAETPLPASDTQDPQLSFRLARPIQDLALRQTLLSARSETDRLRQLAEFLPAFLIRQRRIERVKQVAPRNGHGGKLAGAPVNPRLSLLIDADDTLWENNIYFERAFDTFCDFLDHSALTPQQVRDVLNEIELVNSKIHGYGSKNFGRNLQQAYQHLAEREIQEHDLRHVFSLAERILEQPMEVIEGVKETLEYLSERHDLTLFTKGHPDEQLLKVDRSGLGRYFSHKAVVKEKDAAAYARLVTERSLARDLTWMIGNSPKSDVNPALEAGLNAVLVPHPHTWVLEHQDLRESGNGTFLKVERFADLRQHF